MHRRQWRTCGAGKAYPEPYAAGKVPPELVHARHKARHEQKQFVFSVRYRSGPLGLAFDNRISDKTVVERVGKSMQSDLSDVKAGDRVLAVDQYNVSGASAKTTQRIMSSLGWPRVVVFEVRSSGNAAKAAAEDSMRRRSVSLTFVYPPTLQGTYAARTPEWTPELPPDYNTTSSPDASCPLYFAQSTADEFGCEVSDASEYGLPWQVRHMVRQHLRETGRDWRSWRGNTDAAGAASVPADGAGEEEEEEEEYAPFDESRDYYQAYDHMFPMLGHGLTAGLAAAGKCGRSLPGSHEERALHLCEQEQQIVGTRRQCWPGSEQ